MKNGLKKIALVFSCAAFLLITSGVTIAFFKYVAEGLNTNTITTGSIVFHYQEVDGKGHGISITDAMPVSSNNDAKSAGTGFNFDITSKTVEKVVIPYTVTARLDSNADLVMGDIVDLYLTEVNGNSETPTDLFSGTLPKYNELEQYDGVEGYTEKIIYEGEVPANTANYKKNFRLRIWIDQNANYGKQCSINPSENDTQEKCSTANGTWDYRYNDKEFSITVNIYAQGKSELASPRSLASIIKSAVDGDSSTGGENPTGGVPDPNDDNHKDNNDCDPSTDSTCRTCDPSTDLKCGIDNKKRDKCTDYENGNCKTEDDDDDGDGEDEDIYYYRGKDVDNYVKFGEDETLWRIIKINGDGTIKIMRTAGIDNNATYKFNEYANNASYMLYTNSNVKSKLNTWYFNNIISNDLDPYVAEGNYFCQDAKTTATNPSFSCTSAGLVNSNIGLVTLDEVMKVTSTFFDISEYSHFWTMTPKEYNSGAKLAFVWEVSKSTNQNTGITTAYSGNAPVTTVAFRSYPVINLKADVQVTGTGKKTDPYVVVLNKQIIEKTLTQYVMDDNPTRLTKTSFVTPDGNGFYQMNVTNGFGGGNGTSYYFRGDVNNNIVYFAGRAWRIVRINEDGTVRLIAELNFDEITSYEYAPSGTGVDAMYYTNSNIKNIVEDWYDEYITGDDDLKVANGNYFCEAAKVKIYCSDSYTMGNATPACLESGDKYYEGYTPDLSCTTDGNGYGKVSAKVGLLNYDEAALAGLPLYYWDNQNHYLENSLYNNDPTTFTMTPGGISSYDGDIYVWDYGTFLGYACVNNHCGRIPRPVINLKATVTARKLDNGYYLVK